MAAEKDIWDMSGKLIDGWNTFIVYFPARGTTLTQSLHETGTCHQFLSEISCSLTSYLFKKNNNLPGPSHQKRSNVFKVSVIVEASYNSCLTEAVSAPRQIRLRGGNERTVVTEVNHYFTRCVVVRINIIKRLRTRDVK